MTTASVIHKTAFLGDYLPRKCGIATFTSDVLSAVAVEYPATECFAVPVHDLKGGYEYPDVVSFEIEEQDLSSYQRVADFLDISNVDIVCLQHEFGIFGWPAGSHLLALPRELRMLLRPIRRRARKHRKIASPISRWPAALATGRFRGGFTPHGARACRSGNMAVVDRPHNQHPNGEFP